MTDAKNFRERAEWLAGELKRHQPSAARFHPRDEELAAYAEGELPADRRSEVQEHLVTCSDCAAVVLDLAPLDAAEAAEIPAPRDVEASWQRLRPRLAETGALRPEGRVIPLRPPGPASRPTRWTALAAALLFAFLGSLVVNVVQWRRAHQPLGVSQTVSLRPVRSSSEALRWLSPGQTFEIRLEVERRTGPARVEILTAERKPLASIAAMDDRGVYTVVVPSSLLVPGLYWIRLDPTAKDPKPDEYPLDVARADAAGGAEAP